MRSHPRTQLAVTACSLEDSLRGYLDADPANAGRATTEKNCYQKGQLSRERARIFARDISPHLRGADLDEVIGIVGHFRPRLQKTVAVSAANSLGTLSGTLVAQQALSFLKYELPIIGEITSDYSAEGAKLNQTIDTRIISQPSVQSYNSTTGYAASASTTTDISVTLSAHRYVQLGYNANELASTGRNLFAEQAEAGIYSLAEDYVLTLYGLITTANFANHSVIAQGSFNRSAVIGLGATLFNRKLPRRGRKLLLNAGYYGALMQDSAIVSFESYQRPEGIEEYALPRVSGFDVGCAADLPGNSCSLTGIAFTKEAIVGATRVPFDYVDAQSGSSYGASVPVTDPDTGLVIGLTQYVNHDLGVSNWRVSLVYGCAVGDANRAQLITSA